MTAFEPIRKLLDQDVLDNDGEPIGVVHELFVDVIDGRIEYVRIKLRNNGYHRTDRYLTVPWSAIRQSYDPHDAWCVTASKATLDQLSGIKRMPPIDS